MEQNDLSNNLSHWDYISKYSDWMFRCYEPYIGKKVFDVGAGLGRLVKYYVKNCEKIVATDIFQDQVDFMNRKFKDYPQFRADKCDILADDLTEYTGQFDTVLCINVLEHLSDDRLALEKMSSLLLAGGRVIIMVPAWQRLYCDMDRNVAHYRRYDRGVLKGIANELGLSVEVDFYFNMMGILPYWWKGRCRKGDGESFSTGLNKHNSRIYNLAAAILEPLEKLYHPPVGLSEIAVLKK